MAAPHGGREKSESRKRELSMVEEQGGEGRGSVGRGPWGGRTTVVGSLHSRLLLIQLKC